MSSYAHYPQDIRERIALEEAKLQEQIDSLTHPYQEEEGKLFAREIAEGEVESELDRDIKAFERYYPSHTSQKFIEEKSVYEREERLQDLRTFVLHRWQSALSEKITIWREQEIARLRADFDRRIKLWLERVREVEGLIALLGSASSLFSNLRGEVLNTLDMDNLGDEEYYKDIVKNSGLESEILDTTDVDDIENKQYSGQASKSFNSLEGIKKFFGAISNNQGLQKICDLLGKLEREESIKRTKLIKEKTTYTYTHTKPTKAYKEEISGVTLGRDLENLLPQELALLDDEDFSILFDAKYIENTLFCFEKQGYLSYLKEQEIEEEREIEEEESSECKGAMIICVDTSGSMQGNPEFVAKAMTLFLASKAISKKRPCYLINFSDRIECMDFEGGGGIARLNDFLTLSFNGGTDIAPALREGVKKMQESQFEKSDLLLISDGAFGGVSEDLEQDIKEQREKDNRFYLLDIEGISAPKNLFDKHWIFDSSSQEIKTLFEIKEELIFEKKN